MAIDYQALKTELQTDPLALGYATASGSYGLAAILNAERAGAPTVNRLYASRAEFQAAVDAAEYALLPAVSIDLWRDILDLEQIPLTPAIKGQVEFVWGAGTATRSNLAPLQQHTASRAEELFGAGVVVSTQDILTALRL